MKLLRFTLLCVLLGTAHSAMHCGVSGVVVAHGGLTGLMILAVFADLTVAVQVGLSDA